jgi:DNA modification methylase
VRQTRGCHLAGTTAVVARKLKRNYIGIELNSDYIEIAEQRLQPVEQQHQKEVHAEQIVNKFFGDE